MELSKLDQPLQALDRSPRPAADDPAHGAVGHLSGDEALQQAVCAALLQTPGLDARGIQVAVLGHGEVTLLGRVSTRHEKALAVRVARDCAGARSVHADLSVEPPDAAV